MKFFWLAILICIGLSRPARGAWIEITQFLALLTSRRSRPARGAWIEIYGGWFQRLWQVVAPRKGRVD